VITLLTSLTYSNNPSQFLKEKSSGVTSPTAWRPGLKVRKDILPCL